MHPLLSNLKHAYGVVHTESEKVLFLFISYFRQRSHSLLYRNMLCGILYTYYSVPDEFISSISGQMCIMQQNNRLLVFSLMDQ